MSTVAATETEQDKAAGAPEADTEQDAAPEVMVTNMMALPSASSFEGEGFRPAPDLHKIASELVDAHERFGHVKRIRIEYLWKQKGGMKNGSLDIAGVMRTPPLAKYYNQCDFCIYFSVDNCAAVKMTPEQAYAQMYHLLRHLKYNDDTDKVVIQGHAFEGWPDEVEQFGWWQQSLEALARAVQMRLQLDGPPGEPPALDEVPGDADDTEVTEA